MVVHNARSFALGTLFLSAVAGCSGDAGGATDSAAGTTTTTTMNATSGTSGTTAATGAATSGETPTTSTSTSAAPTSGEGTTTVVATATSQADTTGPDSDSEGDTDGFPALTVSPWGIASSHSSSTILDVWAGPIAATGITWLRGIDNKNAAARLTTAEANGLSVAGIFYYSKVSPGTFPVDDIPGWTAYVGGLVGETLGRVKHWEVWNEPPNFTADKTPQSYATIVQAAYDAAKAVDPEVQIGLAAQSNHVNWLEQTILNGAQGHFDYVTVHPYEILGLVDDGWEAEFMSIVPTLRKMLAARDPDRADAPVWFTEIGAPVSDNTPPALQADILIKAYTMGIAQGVEHIHWFEGRDGDSGPFGLIAGDDSLRPSYTAMTTMITRLGQLPRYRGWLVPDGAYHGFVFATDAGPTMIAWARPGDPVDVQFAAQVEMVDLQTGMSSLVDSYALTASPRMFVDVPAAMLAEAKDNLTRPFPWDGDFTDAPAVSYSAADGASGLHPLGKGKIVMVDGVAARDISGGPGVSFTVDPNFLSYDSVGIRVEAVLRRNGDAGAGFNLKYEGVKGYKSTGAWFNVPAGDDWQTMVWDIVDPQFVGKWGYNFSFDSDSTMFSKYSIKSVSVTKL